VVINVQDLRHLHAQASVANAGYPAAVRYPPAFDWRQQNAVSSVKNQGQCGSCVSFACCALVESRAALEKGVHFLDLSEADLHFCSPHGESCSGWWPSDALNDLKSRGIVKESDFPYAPGSPKCVHVPDHDKKCTKIAVWGVLSSMDAIKNYLATTVPLIAVFHVYSDFYYAGSSVYSHTQGGEVGYHCVEIVGYSDPERCWIAKNSWGASWGDHGYFKIRYGECMIDETSMDRNSSGQIVRFPMWYAQGVITAVVAESPTPPIQSSCLVTAPSDASAPARGEYAIGDVVSTENGTNKPVYTYKGVRVLLLPDGTATMTGQFVSLGSHSDQNDTYQYILVDARTSTGAFVVSVQFDFKYGCGQSGALNIFARYDAKNYSVIGAVSFNSGGGRIRWC